MWKECCSTADVPPPFRRPVVAWSAGLTNLDRCDDADDSWDDGFITRWWTARNECHTYNVTHEHPEYYSEIHSVLFVNEKKKEYPGLSTLKLRRNTFSFPSVSQPTWKLDGRIGWANRVDSPGPKHGRDSWTVISGEHVCAEIVRRKRAVDCAALWFGEIRSDSDNCGPIFWNVKFGFKM